MKSIVIIVEKFIQKKILLVFTIWIIVAACSAHKYPYYFNQFPTQNNASAQMKGANDVDSLLVNKKGSRETFLLPVQNETLIASTSKEAVLLINTELIEVDKNIDTALPTLNVSNTKGIVKKLQLFNKAQVMTDDEVKKGNKKKNGFATIGFILSITGLVLFILGPIALLFCALGALFSLIGIKSEKRKLAIAGLIIGIVGFGLVYLYAISSSLGDG